jgi:DNA-binding winged helix-turn-helix (wHTH) protein/tetratricopeptide (TPR) repeat protein
MSSPLHSCYEFGNFRLDSGRRLLMRNGELVPLKPKVFDTLLVLVVNSGRVLDKEELIQEVWGGAAVEEVGLAKNISNLRKILGENPEEHRFIVTVPGRGYRFVADVVEVPNDRASGDPESTMEPIPLPEQRAPGRISRTSVYAGIIAAVLVLLSGALVFYIRGGPVLAEKDAVLLADFANRTGDPVFDETLAEGLAVQIEQSPALNIFPAARLRRTLQLMGRSPDEKVTPTVAREICERQGLKAYIYGSIVPLGSHYAITLEGANGHDGATLARTQLEADSKEQVLRTLSQAASQLRRRLGESLASIQKFDALLERTTPSLEALHAYSMAVRESRRGRSREAILLLRRAIELDPGFANAYAALAVQYRNARQTGLAAEQVKKAYELRDHVSEREKLYVTALYHELVTADIDKNIGALTLFRQIYPREATPHNNLAVAYVTIGQFDAAIAEGSAAMRLDPTSSIRYGMLGNAFIRADRFDEAADLYRRALEQKFDSLSIRRGLYRLAFAGGDRPAMEQQLNWARANSNEDAALDWQARSAAYFGQWRQSADYARRAVESARAGEEPELAAVYTAESALRGAVLGKCDEARNASQDPIEGTATEQGLLSLTRLTVAIALCGETDRARSRMEQFRRVHPEGTVLNGIWLPVIQAASELRTGNAEKAVDLLAPTIRYEGAAEFWPQYLRGQAYLRLQKPAEAMGEFRKILDHRGQDVTSPLFPLARLGLAKALQLKGNLPEARKSMDGFLAEWKQADSDLPILIEAQKGAALGH